MEVFLYDHSSAVWDLTWRLRSFPDCEQFAIWSTRNQKRVLHAGLRLWLYIYSYPRWILLYDHRKVHSGPPLPSPSNFGWSLMNRLNRQGPRMEHWGTPARIEWGDERTPSTLYWQERSEKYFWIIRIRTSGFPAKLSLYIRPACQTLSNVLATWKKTAPVR